MFVLVHANERTSNVSWLGIIGVDTPPLGRVKHEGMVEWNSGRWCSELQGHVISHLAHNLGNLVRAEPEDFP
jgi:hypothetical protein